jgi:predicted phage-related endonuclease
MAYIEPGSPEHIRLISPSKVSAILGLSRWESQYGLWHRMKGLIDPNPPKDIFAVGHAFEPALAELYRIDHPAWRLSKGEVQYVTNEFGFPAVCTLDRRASKGRARRVVEFKIARNLDDWGDEFTGDCPADYAAQVMAQMLLTGYIGNSGHLLVLSGWFRHFTYEVEWDNAVAQWIIRSCKEFHESLAGSNPPPLDNSVATYEAVKKLHPDIDYGQQVEIPESLLSDLRSAKAEARTAESQLRGLKTKLLDTMGGAQYAAVNGEVVADRRPHPRGGIAVAIRG